MPFPWVWLHVTRGRMEMYALKQHSNGKTYMYAGESVNLVC